MYVKSTICVSEEDKLHMNNRNILLEIESKYLFEVQFRKLRLL